ncbi:PilW family protein [Acinetobacter haemolyticus]|uniref:PilW family protein n=1 Tax=Acinetobacter haemolyticus TaxID=29430 RepID=UPI0021CD19E7|nr:PilW family protein [Acinetobacter haemolyticus]MCU4378596.1 PilW family protein [Acinetobacter haemolyticus]
MKNSLLKSFELYPRRDNDSSFYIRVPYARILASRLAVGSSVARCNPASGFTLVELMVAIALGLLIVAASVQLFITGVTSYKLQKAMSFIQDNASLGLNFIIDDIRKANLSAPVPAVNDKVGYAGIILTQDNVGDKIDLNCTACFSNDKLANFGDANITGGKKNDQLIIRYQAPYSSVDCSGKDVVKDTFVVQRYFVHDQATSIGTRPLSCQAAQYTQTDLDRIGENDDRLSLVWQTEQVILPNVDYFKVRVGYIDGGLNDADSSIAYADIQDYIALDKSANKYKKNIDGVIQFVPPHVHAIQIGVLVQSEDNAGNQAVVKEKNKTEFTMFGDEKVKLASQYQNTHLRQVVEQTISLRNAMGWVNEGAES